MVLTQTFNGAGDTWTPTVINLFVFWLWELPLAYVLAIVFGWGPRGVFLAITIAFSTLALVSALFFRRGRWKPRVVWEKWSVIRERVTVALDFKVSSPTSRKSPGAATSFGFRT